MLLGPSTSVRRWQQQLDQRPLGQLNITRTIEQILGLPPMTQMDFAATPMYDVFTNKPNFAPYNAVPNQTALTTMNPNPSQLTGAAKAWAEWSSRQDYSGPDRSNKAQSNRILWYASNGYTKPYPGDSKVLLPNEVPGVNAQQAPAPSDG
jgi:hypothetical protein